MQEIEEIAIRFNPNGSAMLSKHTVQDECSSFSLLFHARAKQMYTPMHFRLVNQPLLATGPKKRKEDVNQQFWSKTQLKVHYLRSELFLFKSLVDCCEQIQISVHPSTSLDILTFDLGLGMTKISIFSLFYQWIYKNQQNTHKGYTISGI